MDAAPVAIDNSAGMAKCTADFMEPSACFSAM